MKKILIISFLLSLTAYCQYKFDKALDETLLYRGITKQDLTIPLDTIDYANTNQSKQLMPVVYKLMTESIYSFGFMDKLTDYKNMEVKEIVENLYKDAGYDYYYNEINFPAGENLLDILNDHMVKSKNRYGKMKKVLNQEETQFILDNLQMLNENSNAANEINADIFKYNAEQDALTLNTKRILDLLSKLDKSEIFNNGFSDFVFFNNLFQKIRNHEIAINYSDNAVTVIQSPYGFKIAIGTKNNDFYSGNYDIIIDPGGNDVYELTRNYSADNFPCCIIDLAGDDLYKTNTKYSVAASVFSSGFIFDDSGNDTYRLGSCNLASTVAGFSLLYDRSGDDIYEGKDFSVAAALFGCSLLYDEEGNDIYIANTYSQGFGMTCGIGAIVDKKGNDNYIVNPTIVDVLRYTDHYISMCQGYGLGLRPYYAGGIGYIIEGEGNDVYQCDIFGQGGSYWYSLGCIIDAKGNDKYAGFHYNQGSGIHLSVGLLKDCEGWDYYNSNWVSQGCGHDYALGVLWDVKGNDLYSCDGLSQGAGNANGIGILIDENGRDGYLSKDVNTQGYGQQSRGFGSIGILLDYSGPDYYSQRNDSAITGKSYWGVKNDYDLPDEIITNQADEFRLSFDSSKSYTTEEYYIFARTMELQYQNYSNYGFNKLIADSVNTAVFLLSKLNSDNIADIVLIRNICARIGWTISRVFDAKINDHLSGNAKLTNDELIFMVYLIGEARNGDTKETLFRLLDDSRYRLRAAAVNALGKFKFSTQDNNFKEKLFDKIQKLIREFANKKLYNTQITSVLGIFEPKNSAPILLELLKNDYFGVRFAAGSIIKTYGNNCAKYIKEFVRDNSDILYLSPLIESISGLNTGDYNEIVKIISEKDYKNDKIKKQIIKDLSHTN